MRQTMPPQNRLVSGLARESGITEQTGQEPNSRPPVKRMHAAGLPSIARVDSAENRFACHANKWRSRFRPLGQAGAEFCRCGRALLPLQLRTCPSLPETRKDKCVSDGVKVWRESNL